MRPLRFVPAARFAPAESRAKSADRTQHKTNFNFTLISQIRETKVAHKTPRRVQLAGKVPNGVRFGKTCCAATAESAACRTISSTALAAELNSGAGEGNRTPDPLITNQMLYRLSYASNWGKARFRANLSHGSLPDVRDNYIKYHSVKTRRNKSVATREATH
jgi:hypothetical protein